MEVDEVTSSSEEIKEMEGDFLKCEETIKSRNEKKRFERLLGSAAPGFTATDFLSPVVLFAYGT